MTTATTTATAATYNVHLTPARDGYALVVRDTDPDTCGQEPWQVALALGVHRVIFAEVVTAELLAELVDLETGRDLAEHVAELVDSTAAHNARRGERVLEHYLDTENAGDPQDRLTTVADLISDLMHLVGVGQVRECVDRAAQYVKWDLEG